MRYLKIVLVIAAAALLALQLVRPAKNLAAPVPGAGIQARFPVPDHVMELFRRSCFDCHSDTTVYPWYAEIQPVGWWLNSHIEHGKRGIDFDRFALYRPMRQFGKFRDIIEQLTKDEMPIGSYLFIHRYARLSPEEKDEIVRWSQAMMDTMRAHYPPDSLQRKRADARSQR